MKIAIVGITGLVGQTMLHVLEKSDLAVDQLIAVASEASQGKLIHFRGEKIRITSLENAILERPNIALFSASSAISKTYAPAFAKIGCTVIDNSSVWRMQEDIPLVVPEINASILTNKNKIIANPNCSTIQLVMILAPLQKKYGIKRVIVSTYQSVTGTGKEAVEQLENEILGIETTKVYPHKIFKNVLPHCDVFDQENYTKEEWKLMNEPLKILNNNELRISATAVRVPVQGGHSESVNIELSQDFDIEELKTLLSQTSGVVLADNPSQNHYPMPLHSQGRDEVFVGRIRRDFSSKNALNLWIVADNLRKGAATNAIQIASYLFENHLISV